jgi:NAD-dependent dihydropyrimidine dehydrogenase PreA subunit
MYGPPVAFHGFKRQITIDQEFCTGCLECFEAAKARGCGVIGLMTRDGRQLPYVLNPERCVGCFRCLERCRNNAIHVITQSKWIKEERADAD